MHLGINLMLALASLRWGNWKEVKNFQITMAYMIICSLLYNFLTQDDPLWRYKAGPLMNYAFTECMYTFIALPLMAFIFLVNLPAGASSRIIYIAKWSIVSLIVEWMLHHFDGIAYYHGWGLRWSFIFYLTMYPMLMLHHFKQGWAYLLSIGFVFFYTLYFHVKLP